MTKATRSDWGATGPPYTPNRYAEIDLVVCNNRTKNIIKNIESDTKRAFPSDHFPVHFEFKVSLAKNHERAKSTANKWKGPEKPTEETRQQYSKDFLISYNQAKQLHTTTTTRTTSTPNGQHRRRRQQSPKHKDKGTKRSINIIRRDESRTTQKP